MTAVIVNPQPLGHLRLKIPMPNFGMSSHGGVSAGVSLFGGYSPYGVSHQSIGTFGDGSTDDNDGEGKDSVFFNVYAWIGCSGFFGKDVKEYGFEWGKLTKPSTTRQQCRYYSRNIICILNLQRLVWTSC